MGELAALGTAVLWAVSSTLAGSQTRRVPVAVIGAVQFLCASLVLWALTGTLLALGVVEPTSPGRALALAATALIGPGMGDLLYFAGLRLLGVARAFPVSMAASTLFTIALAVPVAGEAVTAPVVFGAALIIGGIYSIAVRPEAAGVAGRQRISRGGVLIVLAAAALWAVSTVTLRVVTEGVAAPVASSIRMPAAAAFAFALARGAGKALWPFHYGGRSVATLAAAGLMGAGVGSMLYVVAVQEAGAARTAILSSTSPLFVLPLAALLLRERITVRVGVGTLLTVAGICLVTL
jgi:drug/metabolite transporter (DMT)-like permease